MKKQLLTTTALVAAGLVAFGTPAMAKVKGSVNGFVTGIFSIGENDDAFDTGAYWLSALAFYKRSKEIARALITKGYYANGQLQVKILHWRKEERKELRHVHVLLRRTQE